MKRNATLFATTLCAIASTLTAQFADIAFEYDASLFEGDPSPYTTAGEAWGKLLDSTGAPLTSTNSVVGIIAGYSSTVPTTSQDWTLLGQSSGYTVPGVISAAFTNIDVSGIIGQEVAVVAIKGLTSIASDFSDLDELDSTHEILILQDSGWDVISGIPSPGTPAELTYKFGKTSIGPMFDIGSYANVGSLGVEINNPLFGTEEGFDFQTVVVPEPSTIALLFGLSALLFVARRR